MVMFEKKSKKEKYGNLIVAYHQAQNEGRREEWKEE